jgi:hypothetical protein
MRNFQQDPPSPGDKAVLVCDDGCTAFIVLRTGSAFLLAEDAHALDAQTLESVNGWFLLPADYSIAFMEAD